MTHCVLMGCISLSVYVNKLVSKDNGVNVDSMLRITNLMLIQHYNIYLCYICVRWKSLTTATHVAILLNFKTLLESRH